MYEHHGSRVARMAASATASDQDIIEERLGKVRVLIQLESLDNESAISFLAAIRQAVLVWCDVTVSLPGDATELLEESQKIAEELRPGAKALRFQPEASVAEFDGVLHIGPTTSVAPNVVSITHTGWVLHMFAAPTEGSCIRPVLPSGGPANAVAAIGASALGIGEVFLRTLGLPRDLVSFDLSLFDYARGSLGSLAPGTPLPNRLEVQALLVGAGTVAAGFAYALAPVNMRGWLALVDHDAARLENFGPHLYVSTATNGIPKTELLRTRLQVDHPELTLISKVERFRLFKHRLGISIDFPAVVISGLDKARPRQDVQRLWAPLHIDMATKDGIQAQVLVRTAPGSGLCFIRKFPIDDELAEEAEIAGRTGLTEAALRDELSDVTDEDIAAAPEARRSELATARARGERRCNVITRADLGAEETDDYVGSAPFTALMAGVFAAGELIKSVGLGLDRDGILVIWHCISRNLFVERTRCTAECECASKATPPKVDGSSE